MWIYLWYGLDSPIARSSPPWMFLGKGFPKICRKFTGRHLCRGVISIKLLCNFIEIELRRECSPVKFLYIFKTPFPKNTYGGLLWMLDNWHSSQNLYSFYFFFWSHYSLDCIFSNVRTSCTIIVLNFTAQNMIFLLKEFYSSLALYLKDLKLSVFAIIALKLVALYFE